MARVQFVVSSTDKERFETQAQREGMTLSAWLRAAAHARLANHLVAPYGWPTETKDVKAFETDQDMRAFFERCDSEAGLEREPDWEEHLAVMNKSKSRGLPKP